MDPRIIHAATPGSDTPDTPDPPVVCRHVRSKGAGVTYGDSVRWDNGFFPTAVFWCLHTAVAVGPDDGLVHPHACIQGRACFCVPER
jgi:hypothetical protein